MDLALIQMPVYVGLFGVIVFLLDKATKQAKKKMIERHDTYNKALEDGANSTEVTMYGLADDYSIQFYLRLSKTIFHVITFGIVALVCGQAIVSSPQLLYGNLIGWVIFCVLAYSAYKIAIAANALFKNGEHYWTPALMLASLAIGLYWTISNHLNFSVVNFTFLVLIAVLIGRVGYFKEHYAKQQHQKH